MERTGDGVALVAAVSLARGPGIRRDARVAEQSFGSDQEFPLGLQIVAPNRGRDDCARPRGPA